MKFYLAAAAAVLASYSPAKAAIVTETLKYTATSFVPVGSNAVPPVNTFAIEFTLTFDNTATFLNDTAAISVLSESYSIASPVGLTYHANDDHAVIGGTVTGVEGISLGEPDFMFAIFNVSSATPTASGVYYSDGAGDLFLSRGLTTLTPAPEPAIWAMLVVGFGAIGAVIRRRNASIRFA